MFPVPFPSTLKNDIHFSIENQVPMKKGKKKTKITNMFSCTMLDV